MGFRYLSRRNIKHNKRNIAVKVRDKYALGYILPIFLILLIVPTIVRMAVIPVDGDVRYLMNGMDQNFDFFSYQKANFFLAFTILAVVSCVFCYWKNSWKYNRTATYIPLLVYALTVILSACISQYREVSFFGTIDRYEGLYVLLGYLFICAVCVNMIHSEKSVRFLLVSLSISTGIICLIGLFQLLGQDLFRSDFGLKLIIPDKYQESIKNVNFKFDRTYTTLFNPNYVGSFTAMTVILSLTYLIFQKGVWKKCIAGVLLLLSLSNLFGSMSRAGMVGLAVALVLLLVLAGKQNLKSRIIVIGGIAVIIVVFLTVNSVFGGVMLDRVKAMVQLEKQDNSNSLRITPAKQDKLFVTGDGDMSYLSFENDRYVFRDADGNVIEAVETDGKYKLAGEKHNDLVFYYVKYESSPGIHITCRNLDFNIIRINGENKILNPASHPLEIIDAPSWGFEGYERIGSARGYIWSRTIPLLKDNIIYGQGPDTYALAFPQNDIFGKAIAFSDPWIIVDKPHNMYLQIGVNTGVLSLLAFLALYLIYFIQCIPLYFKGKLDSFLKVSGAAFFLATFAYMVTGLFNDSVVSVAPVFWVLLGSGIGINLKNRAEKEAPVPAAVSATKVPVPAADGNRKAKKAWKKGKRQA